ncbi:MAG: hypothetical protein Kow0090_10820 [Myxococcota bacterium]
MRESDRIRELEERLAKLERERTWGRFGRRGVPFEYRSETEIFGLPLIHIVTGGGTGEKPKWVAKGIIALGDVAIGALAVGGVALGGICFGGVALGLLAIAGIALGGFALGGMAVGGVAFGGLAIGYLAVGGAAFGYYAIGGGAVGKYVIDPERVDPEVLEFLHTYLGEYMDYLLKDLKKNRW